MEYSENRTDSKKYKEEYLRGINAIIEKKTEEAEKKRSKYIENIFTEPEKYRADLKKLLGWPLTENDVKAPPEIASSELLSDDGMHELYRLMIKVLPGLKTEGLLYKLKTDEKRPLVVVQHGGLGDPELIGGFFGSTSNYNNMLQRVKRHGVHVFAPLTFVWNSEKSGVPIDRVSTDAALKRVGSSIAAIEVFSIKRCVDLFASERYVSYIGMVGLSYGGFHTLLTAALDERIKSAISCSYFNTRDVYHRPDWSLFGVAQMFDDAEIAALVYPRRLCIEVGLKDELFDVSGARRSYGRLKEICHTVGTDWVDYIEFDGAHEFCRDDGPIERMINDLK